MLFTEELIRAHCSIDILHRGQNYYREGRIKQVVKIDRFYQTEVRGSQTYYTQIELVGGEVRGYCTCHFRGAKWCKHLVAAAYAIMEDEVEEWGPPVNHEISVKDFVDQYLKTRKDFERNNLWEQILAKNPHWQLEIQKYMLALPGPLLDVDSARVQLKQMVEESDDDSELEKEILYPVLEYLNQGNYDTAAQYWLAIYELGHVVSEKSRAITRDLISLVASQIEEYLRESLIPPATAKRWFQIFFSRWDRLQETGGFNYVWLETAWILELFCSDQISARFLQLKLETYDLKDPALEVVKEKIHRIIS